MILAAFPAFNEEVSVGSLVLRAKQYVDWVIVIDDGSSDRTAEVARLAGAEVVSHHVNKGKGAALSSAFVRARELNADVLVVLDCDGQHDPGEIPGLIKPIVDGEADIVVGSRFLNSGHSVPRYRRVGQEALTAATNLVSGHSLTDTQSGYRAFNKKAIKALRFSEAGIGVESEMQLKAREEGLSIVEVPISCSYDVERASKKAPVQHGLEVLAGIVRYISQRHPLTFFGVPGVLMVLIGVFLAVRTVVRFSSFGSLPTGTALLTATFILSGVLSLFTGIILYNMSIQLERLKR